MKLITEAAEHIQVLAEEIAPGQKNYYIAGVFLQGNLKNRNGRVYPMNVLQKEVERYTETYIVKGRALGELGHPDGPTINLERVSHKIEKLVKEGNNYIGRAKIMDTPYGKIVKNFIDEGVQLGVSSRGLGSLRSVNGIDEVQEDFTLASCADIVADPSAPDAFVRGIMEGKEWIWNNGVVKEHQIQSYKNRISKTSARRLEEAQIAAFSNFLKKLTSK